MNLNKAVSNVAEVEVDNLMFGTKHKDTLNFKIQLLQ